MTENEVRLIDKEDSYLVKKKESLEINVRESFSAIEKKSFDFILEKLKNTLNITEKMKNRFRWYLAAKGPRLLKIDSEKYRERSPQKNLAKIDTK